MPPAAEIARRGGTRVRPDGRPCLPCNSCATRRDLLSGHMARAAPEQIRRDRSDGGLQGGHGASGARFGPGPRCLGRIAFSRNCNSARSDLWRANRTPVERSDGEQPVEHVRKFLCKRVAGDHRGTIGFDVIVRTRRQARGNKITLACRRVRAKGWSGPQHDTDFGRPEEPIHDVTARNHHHYRVPARHNATHNIFAVDHVSAAPSFHDDDKPTTSTPASTACSRDRPDRGRLVQRLAARPTGLTALDRQQIPFCHVLRDIEELRRLELRGHLRCGRSRLVFHGLGCRRSRHHLLVRGGGAQSVWVGDKCSGVCDHAAHLPVRRFCRLWW